jgi:hypothetical protein
MPRRGSSEMTESRMSGSGCPGVGSGGCVRRRGCELAEICSRDAGRRAGGGGY